VRRRRKEREEEEEEGEEEALSFLRPSIPFIFASLLAIVVNLSVKWILIKALLR